MRGGQIDRVQRGFDPDDWKPISTIGSGVREIRIRDEAGAFRVIYVVAHRDVVCILHCFQKKTQRTSRPDVELARKRYQELMRDTR